MKSVMRATRAVLSRLGSDPRTREPEPVPDQSPRLSPEGPFVVPGWLIAPPRDPAVPWDAGAPTLDSPVSQLCTGEQMQGDPFTEYAHAVGSWPHYHRKLWEWTYIWAAFAHYGVLRPGARVLGFGVGQEHLPAAFAGRGVSVTATDAPSEIGEVQGWATTNQHSNNREPMFKDNLVDREQFDRLVSFEVVDMNAIPSTLRGFDGCWSSCALEHLGSIDAGLDFIENSLATLAPGGVAVHTTEFNLSSNEETFDQNNLALFRRQDIERLVLRLVGAGHEVAPLKLHPGSIPVDEHIDLPPYSMPHLPGSPPHLKLEIAGYVTTSIGLIVRKSRA